MLINLLFLGILTYCFSPFSRKISLRKLRLPVLLCVNSEGGLPTSRINMHSPSRFDQKMNKKKIFTKEIFFCFFEKKRNYIIFFADEFIINVKYPFVAIYYIRFLAFFSHRFCIRIRTATTLFLPESAHRFCNVSF